MSEATHTDAHAHHDDGSATRKKIFVTTGILTALTVLEFIIAGVMDASTLRLALFIGLTIIKAFYIISVFMHLGDEVKRLGWSILLPFIFIVWLLIALGHDGNAYGEKSGDNSTVKREKMQDPPHGGAGHGTEHHDAAPVKGH